MRKNKKLIFAILALGVVVFFAAGHSSFAADPPPKIVNVDFPCPDGSFGLGNCQPNDSIPNYLNNIYKFAVGIAGLLALGMIVAGGVYYTVSAGSSDKQKEAKDMITSAVLGVALLLGSYLILKTINPQIVTLDLNFTDISGGELQKITQKSSLEEGGFNNDCGDFASVVTRPQTSLSKNCGDRRALAPPSGIKITADKIFYNEYLEIPAGSMVWQYPYYNMDSKNPKKDASCLFYAYRSPNGSNTHITKFQDTLRLCAPREQKFGNVAGSDLDCSDKSQCAKKFNVPYPAQNSEDLEKLMTCIAQKIPDITNKTKTWTYDESHPTCNFTRGQPTQQDSTCSHARNSCHYGGRAGTQGAEAVDYSLSQYSPILASNRGKKIIEAAMNCGAKSARCEAGGISTKCVVGDNTDHVHVNAPKCDVN